MRAITKNIHWIGALLALVVIALHIFIVRDIFGYTWNIAVDDAICDTAILSAGVWSIILLIRAYPTKVTLFTYSVIVALGLAAVSVFADWQLMKWWLTRSSQTATGGQDYLVWLKQTLPVRFIMVWVFYSWMSTNAALRKSMTALDTRFQQQADASSLLKEAELFKLRQQLQPHFLYNSLNSINALVMVDTNRAQEMIGKLSDFLRGSVKRESEDAIPVSEELNYIESYLAIESVRFGNRLNVFFDKNYSATATIPPFLFQPILENAIKFGLYGKTGKVEINIGIKNDGQMLTLTVTNPYDPLTQPAGGTGFGLQGIRRRLYLLYARNDLLETMKNEETFTTILQIPQDHA